MGRRQDWQATRIANGVESGALTEKETERLSKQQERIDGKVDRFTADEDLSLREKMALERSLNRASRNIYRQKHDGQTAEQSEAGAG